VCALPAGGAAERGGLGQLLGVQVDQCQAGPAAGQVHGHGPAEALSAAGDHDRLALDVHLDAPGSVAW
jgi:hypothetical protein